MAAAGIDVGMIQEHGRRQDDVSHGRGLGHELLMHDGEQVLAGETLLHQCLMRRHRDGIGVLDQHCLHRSAALQGQWIAGQDGADARLVEDAGRGIDGIASFEGRMLPVEDRGVVVEGAATFILPGASHGRNAEGGMHVHRAVALAREAITEAEEGALRLAHEMRKGLDLADG